VRSLKTESGVRRGEATVGLNFDSVDDPMDVKKPYTSQGTVEHIDQSTVFGRKKAGSWRAMTEAFHNR
jgi:hypothetical protein